MGKRPTISVNQNDELHSAGYAAPRGNLAGSSLREPDHSFWINVVVGVSLGGALWPFLRFLLNMLEPEGSNSLLLLPVLEMFYAGLISLLFGGVVCVLTLAILSTAVALGLNLVLKTLQTEPEQMAVGAATGGISGLLLSLPFCFVDEPSYLKCALLIGTATVLAELGGIWGAWRSLYGQMSSSRVHDPPSHVYQFGLRKMFVLTIWFAVILTFLKYFRVLNERLLWLVGMWGVLQVVFLTAVVVLVRRFEEGRFSAPDEDQRSQTECATNEQRANQT